MKKVKMLIVAITIASSLFFIGCGKEEPKYECSDRQEAIEYCKKCAYDIRIKSVETSVDLRNAFYNDGEKDWYEDEVINSINKKADNYILSIENIIICLENDMLDLSEEDINNYYLDAKKIKNEYLNNNNQE